MAEFRKETPYAFWERIGSPKFVVAPMVDNSDLAFRMHTRKYGAHLTYTQMLNSNIFTQSKEVRQQLFDTCPEDRPLVAQIAGHDPAVMLQAAKMLEDHCDAIDINLGCPQGIAKRGRYGAFLMEELELLAEIVRTLVKEIKVPIICKSRIYKDFDRTIRLYETLVNAGASAITVHGRTREEKGHLVAEADWETIRRIKAHFAKAETPVPVIANGGIENLDDVMRCLELTGVDAVMTSEAILENPAIFTRNTCMSSGEYRSHVDLAEEYLDLCERFPVYHSKVTRSHIMKILYRYVYDHTELLKKCGESHSTEEFRAICREVRLLIASTPSPGNAFSRSWYNRHRYETEVLEDGTVQARIVGKKSITDPDQLLNLKSSFMRGDDDAQESIWGVSECGGEEGGGIFAAMNLFGLDSA